MHERVVESSSLANWFYFLMSFFRHRGNSLTIEGDFKAFWQWLFYFTYFNNH